MTTSRAVVNAVFALLTLAVVAGLVLMPSRASAQPATLWAVDGAGGERVGVPNLSNLYTLNPGTGAATLVNPITINTVPVRHVTALAVHPNGTLYGVMGPQTFANTDFALSTLITINEVSGVATVVGSVGSLHHQIPDIDFDPWGNLWGWTEFDAVTTLQDNLIAIDISNGTATVIGSNIGTFRTGLAIKSTGAMYLKDNDDLHLMNQATGVSVSKTDLSATPHNLLAFDLGDALYTGTRSSGTFTLQTIDHTTGVVSTVGSNTREFMSAIAFDRTGVTPPAAADLAIDKMVDNATPDVGQDVVFTISVANAGPDDATGVVVQDLLPAGYSHVSHTGDGTYVPGSGVWTIGPITNGTAATLEIAAMVVANQSSYTNVAEVIAVDQFDPDSVPNDGHLPSDDMDDATTTPTPVSDLRLEKTVSNDAPLPGALVEFSVTVFNDGPSNATGVVVTDLLPAGYAYASDDAFGAYDSDTGVWTVGAVANSGSELLTITALVLNSGASKNVAEVTASNEFDPDSTPDNDDSDQSEDDEDSADITLGGSDPAVNGTVEVIVNGPTRSAARSKRFAVRITNNGTAELTVDNSNLIVSVNSDTSLVSCQTFSKTLSVGRSTRVRCIFDVPSSGIVPGDTVEFCAVLSSSGDTNTSDNTDQEVRIAR